MRILERRYLLDFIKGFLLVSVGLGTLMTLIDAFKSTGSLLKYNPETLMIVEYSLLSFPRNFVTLMPISALVGALVTVGQASGARELVAVTAAGGRLKRLLAPLVIAGMALTLLSFAINELMVPASAARALKIKNHIQGVKSPTKISGGITWMRSDDGSIVRLGLYSKKTGNYHNASIFRVSRGRLTEITQAREAVYLPAEKTWRLKTVSTQDMQSGEITRAAKLDYPNLPSPSSIGGKSGDLTRLSAFELSRHLKRLKAAGFRNPELSIRLQSKFASPLINLVMIIVGVAIAARRSVSGIKAAALGLIISSAYWLMMSMGTTLGVAGVIPLFLAAWLAPTVLTGASAWLYWHIPE